MRFPIRLNLRLEVTVELTDFSDGQTQSRSRRFLGRHTIPGPPHESWDLFQDHSVPFEADLDLWAQVFLHTEIHLDFDFSSETGRSRQRLGRVDYLQVFAGRGPPGSGSLDLLARQLLIISEEDLWERGYELEEAEVGEIEV